jgi:hypothetical protein
MDISLLKMLYWQDFLQEAEHKIFTWGQVQTEGWAAERLSSSNPAQRSEPHVSRDCGRVIEGAGGLL